MNTILKTTIQLAVLGSVCSLQAWAQKAIQFENPVPPGYDPAIQVPQFADVCPDMKLPPGHVYVAHPSKEGWTHAKIFAKGATHWSRLGAGHEGGVEAFFNNPQFAKKGYNDVPRIREIFKLSGPPYWPNGFLNEEQARQAARKADIRYRLWIGETMEGDDYVPEGEKMWGWFYDELMNRYEAQKRQDGVPYYVAHNYFTRWPSAYNLGFESREKHEALYDTPWEKWPKSLFHPGQPLGRTNLIVEGIYVNAPDLAPQQMLQAIMHMELSTKMGKTAGLFLFAVHEWHPGFAKRFDYPEGVFYRSDKAPLDPNHHIALAFLSQEYGKVFVEWGVPHNQPASMKPKDHWEGFKGKDFWFAKGETEPSKFPFYPTDGNQNRYYNGGGDMSHLGIYLWARIGGQVAGGTPYYATYRIDGGPWIERTKNGSDLVAAYYEKRGVTRVRILGNKMLICYFNLKYADNEPHTIEVQNPLRPSQTFTGTVCGNGVHAAVVNL